MRARNGIEWSMGVGAGEGSGSDEAAYTGPYVTELPTSAAIPIEGYTFDRNIVDLQVGLEANKQVTTDVLAHHTKSRYYKLDISIMYVPGASVAVTNAAIQTTVDSFFKSQFFGGIVQLSDLLQIIHNVGGVDNVRWSSDAPNQPDTFRVRETDEFGIPLANVLVDRITQASGESVTRSLSERQQLVITGAPKGGTFKLRYGLNTTPVLASNISAGNLSTAIQTVSGVVTTVTGTGTAADPFIATFAGTATRNLLEVFDVTFTGGPTIFTNDYALKDDELPRLPKGTQEGDTVPGFIIRSRAQSTWGRL